jgi:hypothetical protein
MKDQIGLPRWYYNWTVDHGAFWLGGKMSGIIIEMIEIAGVLNDAFYLRKVQ